MKKRTLCFVKLTTFLIASLIFKNVFAQTWKPIGPGPMSFGGFGNVSGRVIASTVSSKGLYISVEQGGLWRSKNFEIANPTWENITDKMVRSFRKTDPILSRACTYVQNISIHPFVDNIIYAIVGGSGLRIIRSLDAGDNWEDITGSLSPGFSNIIIDPTDFSGKTLYLTTNNELILQSTDAGKTWVKINYNLPQNAQYIDIDYTLKTFTDKFGNSWNGLVLYHILRNSNNNTIEAWQTDIPDKRAKLIWNNIPIDFKDLKGDSVKSNIITRLHIVAKHPVNPFLNIYQSIQPVFISMVGGSTLNNVYGLQNKGNRLTFSPCQNKNLPNIDNSSKAFAFGMSSTGTLYVVGVRECYQSVNNGENWVGISVSKNQKDLVQTSHHDNHSICFYNSKVYLGGDGGIYRFNPLPNNQAGINTWESLNTNTLSTSLLYSASMNPADENNILCGTQDNKIGMYKNGLWQSESGLGDVGPVKFDPNPVNNGNNAYCTSVSGFSFFFRRNVNGIWENKSPKDAGTQNANIVHFSKFAINPKNTNQIAIGIDRIYETFDKADNWGNGAASPVFTKDRANADAIAYAPDGTLWAAYKDTLWHRDTKNKWAYYLTNLTNQIISIKPDFNTNYIHPKGSDLKYDIYFSTNINIFKFNSIDQKISVIADRPNKDELINGIEYINDPAIFPLKLIFAATEAGIYYSVVDPDKTLIWNDFTGNLPYPNVIDIEYNQNLKMFTIATWGRGGYTINLKDALKNIFKPTINNTTLKVQIFDGIFYLGRPIGSYIDYQDYVNKYLNLSEVLLKNCNAASLLADKWHRVTMQYKSPINAYSHDMDILNFYNKDLKYSDDLLYSCPNNDKSCINTIATLRRQKEMGKLIGEWSTPFLTGPAGSYLAVTTEVYDSKGIIRASSFPFSIVPLSNQKMDIPEIKDVSIESIDGCHQIYDPQKQSLSFSLDVKGLNACIDTIIWRYIIYDKNMNRISLTPFDSMKTTDPALIFKPKKFNDYGFIGKVTATLKLKNNLSITAESADIYLLLPMPTFGKYLLHLEAYYPNIKQYIPIDLEYRSECNNIPILYPNTIYRFTLMTSNEDLIKAKDIVNNYSYVIPLFGKAVLASEKNKVAATSTDPDNIWSHFKTGADGTSFTINLSANYKSGCNINASFPFYVYEPIHAQLVDLSNNSLDGCNHIYDTGKPLTFALDLKKPTCLEVEKLVWSFMLYDKYGDKNPFGEPINYCTETLTTTNSNDLFKILPQKQGKCNLKTVNELQGIAIVFVDIAFKNNILHATGSYIPFFIYYDNVEKVGDYLVKLQLYDNTLKQYINYDWKQKKDNNGQYALTPNSQFRFTLRSPNERYLTTKSIVNNYSVSYQCQGLGCNSFMNESNKLPADDNNDLEWSHFSTGASGSVTINLTTQYNNICVISKTLPFTVNKPVPKSSKEEQGPMQWTSNSTNIDIIPNPNSGVFNITMPDNITNAKVEITDAAGRSILRRDIHRISDKRFNLSHYAKGIYYIKVNADKYSASKKVVIQ